MRFAMKSSAAKKQDHQPGLEYMMDPQPRDRMENYLAAGKLKGKKAIITGGDSGIGRATAIGFAKEGADVAIFYLEEDRDAETTRKLVEAEGQKCVLIRGDISDPEFCQQAVDEAVSKLGGLDILINNAGEQHVQEDLEDITPEQLEKTFRTNIFAMFYLAQKALEHLGEGAAIVNTASITAYKGHEELMDYASTKGAIVSFTRSLSQTLAERGIRVNAVAPGPIWTPLIPASFDEKQIKEFGKHTPLGRPGQPDEVAPCYIFLASNDASYMTGQVLHPNGGQIVNG
jgi:NAD(P)-dependent dehydrogenase (short-subunit alcohol dehydrogenase family)